MHILCVCLLNMTRIEEHTPKETECERGLIDKGRKITHPLLLELIHISVHIGRSYALSLAPFAAYCIPFESLFVRTYTRNEYVCTLNAVKLLQIHRM